MNKIEITSRFPVILVGWFCLGVAIGFLLDVLELPGVPPTAGLYSLYKDYLEEFSLFCWVMVSHIFLMPLAFFLIWQYGFKIVLLRKGGRLVFLAIAVVGSLAGFGGITFEGSNSFSRIVRALIGAMDWFGAAVVAFIGLYVLVVSVVVVFKHQKEA